MSGYSAVENLPLTITARMRVKWSQLSSYWWVYTCDELDGKKLYTLCYGEFTQLMTDEYRVVTSR